MAYLRTKGIVIKEVSVREADKIVTIFSDNHGKMSFLARGAKRPGSRLLACTQYLSYCDFVLFKGRDMPIANSGEVIEPFYNIRNDVVRLTYAAHMVELINDVVVEEQPSVRLLKLLLNSLYMLAETKKDPELITRVFELRMLSILGYSPFVNGCLQCGCSELESLAFSFKMNGFICCDKECIENDKNAILASPGTIRAINHIVNAKMDELFRFELSKTSLDELSKIVSRYLNEKLEKNYRKLDFLKCL